RCLRERETARALKQHFVEANELRECTFQPTLEGTSPGLSSPWGQLPRRQPLYKRVWEVERERQCRVEELRTRWEEEEGATFSPTLGRLSQKLAREARPPKLIARAGA
ncbi:unnamed protein product, partial [Discosporangium mesarthrocarpum]